MIATATGESGGVSKEGVESILNRYQLGCQVDYGWKKHEEEESITQHLASVPISHEIDW